jgi:hypothetical protein
MFVQSVRSIFVCAVLASLASCATTPSVSGPSISGAPRTTLAASRAGDVEIVFRRGRVFARRDNREWPIAEVGRDEMLWAPEGQRFAYLRAPSDPKSAKAVYRIVIRNVLGDSVNEFPAYGPGRPSQLAWLGDQRLCYLTPVNKGQHVYVVHHVETAEIVDLHRGSRFTWSPGRRRVAYVAGPRKRQTVSVDGQSVWPATGKARRRRIVGDLVWSPDGNGLTFISRRGRRTHLVVMLDLDDADSVLTWPIPRAAAKPGNRLFWAESKVVIGQSVLQPRYAASWRRVR